MNPIVSIITPAYNSERFIAETIQSVMNQTFPDWEMIIVVDGATDRTLSIAEAFTSDPRIQVHYKENSGVADTRNEGLKRAKGKYIAFLDADDLWHADNLEKKIRFLDAADDKIVLVHSDIAIVNEQGIETGEQMKAQQGQVLNDLLYWNKPVITGICSNALVRTSVIEQVVGFDINLSTAADQDFAIRIAANGQFGAVNQILVYYRMHANSMHMNISLMEKDHIYVFRKMQQLGLFKSRSFRKKCFAKLYLILAGSWWKDGKRKGRGFLFLLRSIFTHPAPFLHRIIR